MLHAAASHAKGQHLSKEEAKRTFGPVKESVYLNEDTDIYDNVKKQLKHHQQQLKHHESVHRKAIRLMKTAKEFPAIADAFMVASHHHYELTKHKNKIHMIQSQLGDD